MITVSLGTGNQVAVDEDVMLQKLRQVLSGKVEDIVARPVAKDVADAATDTQPDQDDTTTHSTQKPNGQGDGSSSDQEQDKTRSKSC